MITREIDVLGRSETGDLEDPRRIRSERDGDHRPLQPGNRDFRLHRRLALELPGDLRIHLTAADEVQVSRQTDAVGVEADADTGERYRQERRRLHLQGIRKIRAVNRDIRAGRDASAQLIGRGVHDAVLLDRRIWPREAFEDDRIRESLNVRRDYLRAGGRSEIQPGSRDTEPERAVVAERDLAATLCDGEAYRNADHRDAVLIDGSQHRAPILVAHSACERAVVDRKYVRRDVVADHIKVRQTQRGPAAAYDDKALVRTRRAAVSRKGAP